MDTFDFNKYKEMPFSSLIDNILSLSGSELAVLACLLGFAITTNTTINEQDSIGNFFELLGEFILTTSAQNYKLQSQKNTQMSNIEQQINDLYRQINDLKRHH